MVNEYGSVAKIDPATGLPMRDAGGGIIYEPGSAAGNYLWGGSSVGATVFIGDAYQDSTGKWHYPSYEAPAATGGGGGGVPNETGGSHIDPITGDTHSIIAGIEFKNMQLLGDQEKLSIFNNPHGASNIKYRVDPNATPDIPPPLPTTPATCPYAGISSVPKAAIQPPEGMRPPEPGAIYMGDGQWSIPMYEDIPENEPPHVYAGSNIGAAVQVPGSFAGIVTTVKSFNPAYLAIGAVVIVGLIMLLRRR